MLKKKVRGLICTLITSIIFGSSFTVFAAEGKIENIQAKGSYSIKVTGYDWGPGVNKAIITIDKEVSEVNNEMFKVEESKNWYAGVQSFNRNVTKAYLSDKLGNQVEGNSKTITLELAVSPNEGSPFLYNLETTRNSWTTPYNLKISLVDGASLKCGDEEITELNINEQYVSKDLGTVDKFIEETYSNEGDISMKYSYYEPENDDKQNALIIWLHGAGEGGSDTTIATLGNKVGALVEDNIQDKFDGAYVLAPQSPTMWMDSTGNAEYTSDGSSIYISSLMNLIKSYVSNNTDIDTNRIYIGGCSNGGYMTMAMILEDPEYFAAAYPICEAYSDSWINDEKIESLKNLPLWFTYAKNDQIVIPGGATIPTIERLRAINNNVHASVFENVVDTSGLYKDEAGNPYEYEGHWSWIYAFNDECIDGKENLWSWLAEQRKVTTAIDDEGKADSGKIDDEGKDDLRGEEGKEDNKLSGDIVNNTGDSIISDATSKGDKSEISNNGSTVKTGDVSSFGVIILGLMSVGAAVKFKK